MRSCHGEAEQQCGLQCYGHAQGLVWAVTSFRDQGMRVRANLEAVPAGRDHEAGRRAEHAGGVRRRGRRQRQVQSRPVRGIALGAVETDLRQSYIASAEGIRNLPGSSRSMRRLLLW